MTMKGALPSCDSAPGAETALADAAGRGPPAASGRRVATQHQRNEGGFLAPEPIGIGTGGGSQATVRR